MRLCLKSGRALILKAIVHSFRVIALLSAVLTQFQSAWHLQAGVSHISTGVSGADGHGGTRCTLS